MFYKTWTIIPVLQLHIPVPGVHIKISKYMIALNAHCVSYQSLSLIYNAAHIRCQTISKKNQNNAFNVRNIFWLNVINPVQLILVYSCAIACRRIKCYLMLAIRSITGWSRSSRFQKRNVPCWTYTTHAFCFNSEVFQRWCRFIEISCNRVHLPYALPFML